MELGTLLLSILLIRTWCTLCLVHEPKQWLIYKTSPLISLHDIFLIDPSYTARASIINLIPSLNRGKRLRKDRLDFRKGRLNLSMIFYSSLIVIQKILDFSWIWLTFNLHQEPTKVPS